MQAMQNCDVIQEGLKLGTQECVLISLIYKSRNDFRGHEWHSWGWNS